MLTNRLDRSGLWTSSRPLVALQAKHAFPRKRPLLGSLGLGYRNMIPCCEGHLQACSFQAVSASYAAFPGHKRATWICTGLGRNSHGSVPCDPSSRSPRHRLATSASLESNPNPRTANRAPRQETPGTHQSPRPVPTRDVTRRFTAGRLPRATRGTCSERAARRMTRTLSSVVLAWLAG